MTRTVAEDLNKVTQYPVVEKARIRTSPCNEDLLVVFLNVPEPIAEQRGTQRRDPEKKVHTPATRVLLERKL